MVNLPLQEMMNKWIAIAISSVLAVAVIVPGVLYAREPCILNDHEDRPNLAASHYTQP